MCMHDSPMRNDAEKWWGTQSLPDTSEGEVVVFEECGRCSPQVNGKGDVDYHSFNFRYIKKQYGGFTLKVRHGGGQEAFDMGYAHTRIDEILAKLDSDARFLMFVAFMHAHQNTARSAHEAAMAKCKVAFIEGRLKKRKLRKGTAYKVWIEPKTIQTEVAI